MLMKWLRGDTTATEPQAPSPQPAAQGSAQFVPLAPGASDHAPAPLAAEALRRTVDPAQFGFATTAEIAPASGLVGQERALEAIAFGTGMRCLDFNVFVLGPPATGKSTAVRTYLEGPARQRPTPPDWVYVNNFEAPNRPNAIRLPAGRARPFARAMLAVLDELAATVPAVFEGDDYQSRRRAIDQEFRATQEDLFAALNHKAEAQNITILRTPTGFVMAPMHDGEVVKPETFAALPVSYREDVAHRIEALQKELGELIEAAPRAERDRRRRLAALDEEIARGVVSNALAAVRAAFADVDEVKGYLDAVASGLVADIALFIRAPGDGEVAPQPLETARDSRLRRFLVNVVVAHDDAARGAPVHEELNPIYSNIVGRVEHKAHMGALETDFMLVSAGALHRANGGFLLVDARKLLTAPLAWDGLKRALKAGQIRIEQPIEMIGLFSTESVEPEPIPLDVKVILFGDRELYYLLSAADPEFASLFKVQADFDDSMPRSGENDAAFAGLVASIVMRHQLKPVSAAGVARLLEESGRIAADRDRVSLEVGRIADIVREADHLAGAAARAIIEAEDVARAVAARRQRADRLRERAQESIARGIVLIDTAGAKVGQINGLSVLQLGDMAFGRPNRISARVRFGSGRVTDIEREAKLGGPLHSKGVMILWGYLAGRYALDAPLALAASVVLEQSYGGVDGDSASSTELYALLSALAEVPIRQGLAVTGSVNQWGEVQAIGGVNEKIEGFFDVCRERGLSGDQGVLVPAANAQHLMLSEEVVTAAREGRFAILPVATIDQGIELLTGMPAGERGADGRFPEGSVNRLVEDKLAVYARHARMLSRPSGGDGDTAKGGFA
jgi:lon-related putative ATP-dependent protease